MKATKKLAALLGVALLTLTGTAQALLISPTSFTNLGEWQITANGLTFVTTAAGTPPNGDHTMLTTGTTYTLNLADFFPGINILGFSFDVTGLNVCKDGSPSCSGGGNIRTTSVTTNSGGTWGPLQTSGYIAALGDSGEIFTSITFTRSGSLTVNDVFTISNFNYATAVPVPAAVWLMGSALLGLVGIGRRKRTA